jgi:NADH-quinone oxidoreductase subunit J
MPSFLFYIFAAITLGFGLNVILARNPVTSALSLAVSFVGLAALFISLDAYFIGIIQILVYTGAVMVLFLFIIMLLDIQKEEAKRANLAAVVGGVILAVVLTLQVASLSLQTASKLEEVAQVKTIQKDLEAGTLPDAKLMGMMLFERYGFHLQAIGLILLVGTVGVVVLSKRETPSKPAI